MSKQYKNKIIPEDEFIKWVMGIAWKTICLYFRKQNQFYNLYNTMDGFVLDEISPYISDNSINPKVLVDNWDIENIISNALKKMKKPYAEVLRALLKGEIKKYTTEQKKRNVNMDKVYTRISRCRAQMRDLLIQAGFELNF